MAVQSYIDGEEVTDVVMDGSVTRKLNRPAEATIRIPTQYTIGQIGSRLKVVIEGTLSFHGMILTISDDCGEDTGYTEYVALDPMELWQWRPARDPDGDFSDPDFMRVVKQGPQIMQQILQTSEALIELGADDAEGPLFISYGTFEGGGIDLSGAPTNWPMTIYDIGNLLTSTGELDIVLEPIDEGGNMARVSCYNGDFGQNLSGSVVFEYAIGAHNVRELRQVEDGTTMANKIWYYLGPRLNQQHWHASVTGGDPSAWEQSPYYAAYLQVLAERDASRNAFGVRMDVQVHDTRNDEGIIGVWLFRRLWIIEQFIRNFPRQLVHFMPIRGYDPNAFGIGDIIGINVGPYVRGPFPRPGLDLQIRGFSGAMRVFEYTVSWDENGVTEITDIVCSPEAGVNV